MIKRCTNVPTENIRQDTSRFKLLQTESSL